MRKRAMKADELFDLAMQNHRSGRLREAETLYDRVLKIDQHHFDALHMSGVLVCQTGRLDKGADLIGKALAANPLNALAHHNLGKALHDLGHPEKAIASFKKAIALKPDFVSAYCGLANSLNEWGEAEEAVFYCRKAIGIQPDHAEAHNNLGNALRILNRPADAIDCYRRAIECEPDFALAHYNLGNTLKDIGRPEEAISSFNRAISIRSDYAEAYNNLGITLTNIGRCEDAIDCYKCAIKCRPDFALAHYNLGNTLSEMEMPGEAVVSFNRAISIRPDYWEAYDSLGSTLYSIERPDEAEACFKKSITIKPEYTKAIGNLADLYERANDIDRALETARLALKHDPRTPIANLVAAKCERRQGNFKSALERFEKIDLTSLNSSIHMSALVEMGTLYDRIGAYEKAFEHFSNANMLISKTWKARRIAKENYISEVSSLISWFVHARLDFWESQGEEVRGHSPVFLVGFPRSGTTLLEQILNPRHGVTTLEEKPLVASVIDRFHRRGLRYPYELAQTDFELVEEMRSTYFLSASEFTQPRNDSIIVDKLPLNIIHIGLIHRLFPRSKIILSLRHPCDVCLSCFIQRFKLNESMVHFLDLADTARLYGLVMSLWTLYAARLPLKLHVLKYEDIVNDFENETKRLFNFLEIPWDRSVHDYKEHAKSRRILTPSYHQVVEPIYAHSVDRWKNYLRHLEPIFGLLEPHIENFGYSLRHD